MGWKGYGFHFSENRVEAFSYLDTEKDGLANINLRRGTIECWFKPDWQSGEGPVEEAPLVAMGSNRFDPLFMVEFAFSSGRFPHTSPIRG